MFEIQEIAKKVERENFVIKCSIYKVKLRIGSLPLYIHTMLSVSGFYYFVPEGNTRKDTKRP